MITKNRIGKSLTLASLLPLSALAAESESLDTTFGLGSPENAQGPSTVKQGYVDPSDLPPGFPLAEEGLDLHDEPFTQPPLTQPFAQASTEVAGTRLRSDARPITSETQTPKKVDLKIVGTYPQTNAFLRFAPSSAGIFPGTFNQDYIHTLRVNIFSNNTTTGTPHIVYVDPRKTQEVSFPLKANSNSGTNSIGEVEFSRRALLSETNIPPLSLRLKEGDTNLTFQTSGQPGTTAKYTSRVLTNLSANTGWEENSSTENYLAPSQENFNSPSTPINVKHPFPTNAQKRAYFSIGVSNRRPYSN